MDLLQRSGLQPKQLDDGRMVKGLSSYNLRLLDDNKDNPEYLDKAISALAETQDASDPGLRQ